VRCASPKAWKARWSCPVCRCVMLPGSWPVPAPAWRTGLGHLAAALDVPTLSLFGPTNPGFTGAYGRAQQHLASDFACAPCLRKQCTYKPTPEDARRFDLTREQPLCFTRLDPERVMQHLQPLLSNKRIV